MVENLRAVSSSCLQITLFLCNSGPDLSEEKLSDDFLLVQTAANSSVFWAQGMRIAWETMRNHERDFELVLLVNEDVLLFPGSLEGAVARILQDSAPVSVLVGSTIGALGELTYGAQKSKNRCNPLHLELLDPRPGAEIAEISTFNCNFVLADVSTLILVGGFPEKFRHSRADIALGFRLVSQGVKIEQKATPVGVCASNEFDVYKHLAGLQFRHRVGAINSPKIGPTWEHVVFVWTFGGVFGKITFWVMPIMGLFFPSVMILISKRAFK
jgi:hypothetical protein